MSAAGYKENLVKTSMSLRYPDKSRFSYNKFTVTANDTKMYEVAEAMNSLQDANFTQVNRTDTFKLFLDI